MGILSALNSFTFSRKYYAAWNALMAAYTFNQLSVEQKQQVLRKVIEIESSVRKRAVSWLEIASSLSEAGRYQLFALAMMNLGIRPALGSELWFEVKNPHVDQLGASEILASTRHKLQKQFGVEFPDFAIVSNYSWPGLRRDEARPPRPKIKDLQDFVRWTLRYADEFDEIRRGFFKQNFDRFLDLGVEYVMREFNAHVDYMKLWERYRKVKSAYDGELLPLVKAQGGLKACPEDLKFTAMEMYIRVTILNFYFREGDSLLPPLTTESVAPLPM